MTGYTSNPRAQISVELINSVDISEATGILFYIDLSDVIAKEDADMCASVTINGNTYRSLGSGATSTAVAYYYQNGSWVETTNINQCRMQLPDHFAGWVYVPASSYYDKTNKVQMNSFDGITVSSMVFYTDGYTPSEEHYIIFDEIVFVK